MGDVVYEAHPDRLPLVLQDHGNPVRFRNLWIRDLEQPPADILPPAPQAEVTVASKLLDSYAGIYGEQKNIVISKEGNRLTFQYSGNPKRVLYARSETVFFSKDIDAEIAFQVEGQKVTGLKLRLFDSSQDALKKE